MEGRDNILRTWKITGLLELQFQSGGMKYTNGKEKMAVQEITGL